jgi:hypothetical protein
MKIRPFIIFTLVALLVSVFCVIPCGCDNLDVNSYKTFVLNEGAVHFSLEYRTYYDIDYLKPAEATGDNIQQSMLFDLKSPKIKGINDYTYIHVAVGPPDELIPDAKSATERAERNASSWADYALLNKCETTIDGVPAYRLDYQNRNIVPAIAGGEPRIEVIRKVNFDAKGYVWMIQVRSDFSTAEADKADFEHILQTFKILD